MINFYTDGAYSSKTKKGGWACYCPELNLKICGGQLNTTNNRMELYGALKALLFVYESKIQINNLIIWSDSKYLIETMNGNFQQKTNLDLWQDLNNLVSKLNTISINWKHIKGHQKEDNGNNIVDVLANLNTSI